MTVSSSDSDDVEKTLKQSDVHRRWEEAYRTEGNAQFYDQAFDYIINAVNAPDGSQWFDAGCGVCAHSIRLAKRGFSVVAADFSDSVLDMARENIQYHGLGDLIELQRQNMLSLNFDDQQFDYIMCWGVLMHIPEVDKAISELARVLKNGGLLVISEGNMRSLQSFVFRNLRSILRRGQADSRRAKAGLEHWTVGASGRLLTRESDITWLRQTLESSGFTVKKHVSGQFTELYNRTSSRFLKDAIHAFNLLWFKHVKIPRFAFGNIIILQKHS